MAPSDASDDRPAPPDRRLLRIGDAEREKAVAELGEHFAAGRLQLDEYHQRLEQALVARTADDLLPLFEDLPVIPSPVAPAVPPVAGHPARRRRPVLAWALVAPWLLVNTMMLVIWASTGGGYFWPIWVMGPWGLAILPASVRCSRGRRCQPVGRPGGPPPVYR